MGIALVILVVLIVLAFKTYTRKYDTVIAYTGGLGSGKSMLSTETAIKLLRRNRAKVARYNFFHPKDKKEKPLLYSNIPIRVSGKEWAQVLTADHLLLRARIVEKSVTYIDEVGSFANQFQFKARNMEIFDEFVRFYRHYTKGGYLVVNDQCSENIVLQIRRRINTVFNLMHFRAWFGLFYTVRCRNMSVSEEIKTIEEQNTEDNTKLIFGFLQPKWRYDTWCYSERYATVPEGKREVHSKLKTNRVLRLPQKATEALTNDEPTPAPETTPAPPPAP